MLYFCFWLQDLYLNKIKVGYVRTQVLNPKIHTYFLKAEAEARLGAIGHLPDKHLCSCES